MMEFASDTTPLLSTPAFVRGWEQCRKGLSGPTLVSDASRLGLTQVRTNNMLLMDGDLHQTLRSLLTGYSTHARLSAVAARLESSSNELLRCLLDKPDVDLIADLAEPLVLEGIMSLLEIPDEHRDRLGALSRGMLGLLEPNLPAKDRRRAVNAALRATLLFERVGAAGTATGFHAALEAAASEGAIPIKTARSTPVVVLHGGYENPLNQLGCVIAWAVEDPGRFRDAAISAPRVLFEEIMRVFSPVRLVARWVTADGEYDDQPLKRGQFAWVDLESANLDDRRFCPAQDVNLSRKQGHLGFGYGRHTCPGAALARLEGKALIHSLLEIPSELLREFTVEWRDGVVARGPIKIAMR